MDFVERRIEQAKRAGFFDNLELHGQPISDLDEERPAGWWGETWVSRDTARRRLHELMAEIPRRKNSAFQTGNHDIVHHTLVEINEALDAANQEVDAKDRADLIDVQAELRAWRARERKRRWGHYFNE